MTVTELLQKKKDLEDNIAKLLDDFRDVTGVRITSVSIETHTTNTGVKFVTWSEVKAEIII